MGRGVEWPSGWRAIDGDEASGLLNRLRFEAPPTHPLAQTRLQAVARSQGTDDVVYQVLDEADRFVVVHLTWSSEPETSPDFPGIEFDGPFNAFLVAQPSFHRE